MQLTIIGCASGMPEINRSSSSYLMQSGGTNLLFDCGDGTARALFAAKTDPATIDGIAISHLHADHWSGFPMLVQTMHMLERIKPLIVFADALNIEMLMFIVEKSYMWDERLGFEIEWKEIQPQNELGNFTFNTVTNKHLSKLIPEIEHHPLCNLSSYSFDIGSNGKRLVYSSDIESVSDLDPICIGDIDLLLIEGAHIDSATFPKWLSSKNIAKTVMTHIPPDRRSNSIENVIFAEDGMKIKI
jgi:ribonuclease BN (tRNA processing enzyme)